MSKKPTPDDVHPELRYVPLSTDVRRLVRERRQSLQMTQMELAQLSGTSHSTVQRLENQEVYPSFELMARICEVLGITFAVDVRIHTALIPHFRRQPA